MLLRRRILITGIRGHLASRLARRLEADPDVERIVGIDAEEPAVATRGRIEFLRADIRKALRGRRSSSSAAGRAGWSAPSP